MRKFVLYKPLPVKELLSLALDHPDAHYNPNMHLPKEEMIEYYFKKLITKTEMLHDYFSIEFNQEEGTLVALPIVHEILKPFPQELPMFILRMASEIDYTNEARCF
jgi:DNA mismatch repair protein MLH1